MPGPVITPTDVGKSQLASKFVLQVDTASSQGSPTWVTVFGVFNFTPPVAYTMQDNSDFDSDGWGSDFPTQRKWSLTASLRDKLYGGAQDPGQAFLQTQIDVLAQVHVRWFDRKGGTAAFEGWAYGQWDPQGGDVTTESTISVTLNGQGSRTTISNPVATSSAPVLSGATPGGAATGALVTITGSFLAGTISLKFAAVAVTAFAIINDGKLVAVMPSGSAGSAAITVTNATGASNALPYTRAA